MKSDIGISSIYFQLILNMASLTVKQIHGAEAYPSVSVLKWKTPDSQYWEQQDLTWDLIQVKSRGRETIYTIEQRLDAIAFTCNWSEPVTWTLPHYNRSSLNFFRVTTYREVQGDFLNYQSYKYSAVLEIYIDLSKITGGYTCESIKSPTLKHDVYVYTPGMSPPYLINAGITLTVKSLDNHTLILPCFVSTPDTSVALLKQRGMEYFPVPPGPYMSFDPRVGFILDMTKIADPFGNYQCVVAGKDENTDLVFIHAVPGMHRGNQILNVLNGNASFSFNNDTRDFQCCSSSEKCPVLRISYCDSPSACAVRSFDVFQPGNDGVKLKKTSCVIKNLEDGDSGVIRCKGDGVDMYRQFFQGIFPDDNGDIPLYLNWEEAQIPNLISIYQHDRSKLGKIYSTQTIYFSCDISEFYFSKGIQWSITWKNGSSYYLKETNAASLRMDHGMDLMRTVKLVAAMDMESITCFAPVWNTSEWKSKSFNLDIQASFPPEIQGSIMEEYRWRLNDTNQTISCPTEKGIPTPIIRWRKNKKVLFSDLSSVHVKRHQGSSQVTFSRVSHDTAGEYVCLAGNPVGRVAKTIRIWVDAPSAGISNGAVCGIAFSVVAALLGGLGFLLWKLKLQRNIIDHLTKVVFRDVASRQGNSDVITG